MGRLRIECAGRFIAQAAPWDHWPVSPGDRHTLLLAAGQLGWIHIGLLAEVDQLEQLHRPCVSNLFLAQIRSSSSGKATFCATVRSTHQIKVLKDHADLFAASPAAGQRPASSRLPSVDGDAAPPPAAPAD